MEDETYLKNVKLWKEAYSKILKVTDKYKNFSSMYGYYDIREIRNKALDHLWAIELFEKYGLKISHDVVNGKDHIRINENMWIGIFGEQYRRTISWSDDDRQPKDGEYLLVLSFSTGAYIFGNDYLDSLFNKFFVELKSYNPKYSDSHNHCLYYSLDNAKYIIDNYQDVFDKYYKLTNEERKKNKIIKLESELKKLKS